MTEPTPVFDATQAALDSTQPVDVTVDGVTATATASADGLNLPPGPDTGALQAFTDSIPDEGHRAIAQALVDAFTVRDQQLQAFIAAYTTAMGDIATLRTDLTAAQATIAALQTQVAALTPVTDPLTP